MTDVFSQEKRSWIMSRVKGRDTKPEILVRSFIFRMGFRFRLHRRDLPGTPDIVLPRHSKVIFVHGCFWHGHKRCPRSKRPTTNANFWNDIKNSKNWKVGFRTETQVHLSDVVATIVPKQPIAEDKKAKNVIFLNLE